MQRDETHCSFSSFFNPLDEKEKDFEVIQLSWTAEWRSRTWALEIQHEFHDKTMKKSAATHLTSTSTPECAQAGAHRDEGDGR